MVFGIGYLSSSPASTKKAKTSFWVINIWLLSFIPLSFVYNVLLLAANGELTKDALTLIESRENTNSYSVTAIWEI